MSTFGYGVFDAGAKMQPVKFEREALRAGEVAIQITHCGVCHSDLHQIDNDWGNTQWPCVPGHEIVGVVTSVGEGVSSFKEGDKVGVGCMVNSCQQCEPCQHDNEQYCEGPKSCTLTYNGPKNPDGTNSYGGYSSDIIVREEFVLRVPDVIDAAEAPPILCAGITVYSPMRHWNLQEGQTLGVAGIGGLGHMAVKIGKALGAKVVALTSSERKVDEIKEMGADEVVVMSDDKAREQAAQTLDMMINTIPVEHDIAPYLELMKPQGKLIVVGNLIGFPEFAPGPMVFNRLTVAGSLIGGIKETQEVLDLCGEHDIRPLVEVTGVDNINEVLDKLREGTGRYRYVLDMAALRDNAGALTDDAKSIDPPVRGEVVG